MSIVLTCDMFKHSSLSMIWHYEAYDIHKVPWCSPLHDHGFIRFRYTYVEAFGSTQQRTNHGELASCCWAKAKDGGNVLEMVSWLAIFVVFGFGVVVKLCKMEISSRLETGRLNFCDVLVDTGFIEVHKQRTFENWRSDWLDVYIPISGAKRALWTMKMRVSVNGWTISGLSYCSLAVFALQFCSNSLKIGSTKDSVTMILFDGYAVLLVDGAM